MKESGDFEITRRDLLKVGAVSVAVTTVPLVAKGKRPAAHRRSCRRCPST